jgi:hypothetical protein
LAGAYTLENPQVTSKYCKRMRKWEEDLMKREKKREEKGKGRMEVQRIK